MYETVPTLVKCTAWQSYTELGTGADSMHIPLIPLSVDEKGYRNITRLTQPCSVNIKKQHIKAHIHLLGASDKGAYRLYICIYVCVHSENRQHQNDQ